MKVLITGGCGYVGSRLSPYLVLKGHNVTVIDTMWYGQNITGGYNLRVITDSAITYRTKERFDVVIHLAAVSNDPSVVDFPKLTWETNVLATQNLLQHVKCDTFILASSGSVYGLSNEEKVTEETELVPMSDYNKSKMVAERVTTSYEKNGIRVVILRPGTIVGMSPRMRFDVAGNALAKSAALGKIIVHGGGQMRPILTMSDMLRAYEFAMENEISGVFNVSTDVVSLSHLGKLAHSLNPNAEIVTTDTTDLRSYRLCTSEIKYRGFKFAGSILDSMQEVYENVVDGTFVDPSWEGYYNAKWMKVMF